MISSLFWLVYREISRWSDSSRTRLKLTLKFPVVSGQSRREPTFVLSFIYLRLEIFAQAKCWYSSEKRINSSPVSGGFFVERWKSSIGMKLMLHYVNAIAICRLNFAGNSWKPGAWKFHSFGVAGTETGKFVVSTARSSTTFTVPKRGKALTGLRRPYVLI